MILDNEPERIKFQRELICKTLFDKVPIQYMQAATNIARKLQIAQYDNSW